MNKYLCFEPGFADDEGRWVEPYIGAVFADDEKSAMENARKEFGDAVAKVKDASAVSVLVTVRV